jgi:hypothetical protein
MITFIIIAIVVFAIFLIAANRSDGINNTKKQITSPAIPDVSMTKEAASILVKQMIQSLKITTNTTGAEHNPSDDSIIDVTGNTYDLKKELIKYSPGVPYWKHQYVYSYAEISGATGEQYNFYQFFKYRFLKGEYLDIEGNSNYAFILLFDLLNKEFPDHKNFRLLERQLGELGYYYPKTKPYAKSFLIQKMEKAGDQIAAERIRNEWDNVLYSSTSGYSFEGNYWGLGTKYKSKLALNDGNVKLLNKLFHPGNNFCGIEYCCLEVLKLFLLVVQALERDYVHEQSSIDSKFSTMADVIARKHFSYKPGSTNYKYSIDQITNELYSVVFKYCENAVREKYRHKRRISVDNYYTNTECKISVEANLLSRLPKIISEMVEKVSAPDEATEIELYAQTTSRWKSDFETVIENFSKNPEQFYTQIKSLASLNKKNPSIENIFFEASKHISKIDKQISLQLYLHYLDYDLRSAKFDNKQFTKTIQKSLFKTNEHLHDFEILVGDFVKERNLEKALQAIPQLYKAKRRKITLDKASIEEVKEQHSGTVELLSEYLRDEYEDDLTSIKSEQVNSDEVKIQITSKNDVSGKSQYIGSISFSPIQVDTLELFTKSNFSVADVELQEFAKSKGVFKNQLIESINELCFSNFDDILIEEEEDYYTLNSKYYQSLLRL